MTNATGVQLLDLGKDGHAAFRERLCACSNLAERVAERVIGNSRVTAVVPVGMTIERALQTEVGGLAYPQDALYAGAYDRCLADYLFRQRKPVTATCLLAIECWLDRGLAKIMPREHLTDLFAGDEVLHYGELADDPVRAFRTALRDANGFHSVGLALSWHMPEFRRRHQTDIDPASWDKALGMSFAAVVSAYDSESWLLAEFD